MTELINLDNNGNQIYWPSWPSVSVDGRYVAFSAGQIYVRDRQMGTTEVVSVDNNGEPANTSCGQPSISSTGSFVAFNSFASNLVPGDTNGTMDIFVHDRTSGVTERVSVNSSGYQGNWYSINLDISGDGRYVAFDSWATNLVSGDSNWVTDVFVRDRHKGKTIRASVDSAGNQGNDRSTIPSISGDGKHVAFISLANNLKPGDTNGTFDIFIHSGYAVPNTIADTTAAVEELLASGDISNTGTATSLNATLDSALSAQERDNVYAARNTLLAFINQVRAQAGNKISEEAAALLIEAANQILASLQ